MRLKDQIKLDRQGMLFWDIPTSNVSHFYYW